VSFPALAIAAAAATEVCRYTGLNPAFLSGVDVRFSHLDPTNGEPVFDAAATAHLFGYVHITEDGPLGVHDLTAAQRAARR
jgi:hypothetical protein